MSASLARKAAPISATSSSLPAEPVAVEARFVAGRMGQFMEERAVEVFERSEATHDPACAAVPFDTALRQN